MQYRKDRKGNDISLLGFGCMRFEGSGTGEYFQKANDQVMEAIRQGINYFDTAYFFPFYSIKSSCIGFLTF